LILTEKEGGLISFKTIEDEIDYRGFNSRDKNTLNWAHDVFNYYWENALDVWPKELIDKAMKDLA